MVGRRYHFVWTDMPGGPELHFRGLLQEVGMISYYVIHNDVTQVIPIDRTLEVNEIIAGE